MNQQRRAPNMKPIGVVVKNGKDVVSFEVDPNGPKMRFIRAIAAVVEGREPYPEGVDLITYGVRVATDNPDFTFLADASGVAARAEWKSLAFPILYGSRPSTMHGTPSGRVSGATQQQSNTPQYSPTGRKLTEPEEQFIPLSWLRNKPKGPQRRK